jgi:hypothetical protein
MVSQPTQTIEAQTYGVMPNDDRDDAQALQQLLDRLPKRGLIEVHLPIGELHFQHPIRLVRSQTLIKGHGQGRTLIESDAPIEVKAIDSSALQKIELSYFTIHQKNAVAIQFDHVRDSKLRNIQFLGHGESAVTLHATEAIALEYLAIDDQFSQGAIRNLGG